jgi:NADH:ubiquinone oxidoreductase subunit K
MLIKILEENNIIFIINGMTYKDWFIKTSRNILILLFSIRIILLFVGLYAVNIRKYIK